MKTIYEEAAEGGEDCTMADFLMPTQKGWREFERQHRRLYEILRQRYEAPEGKA